MIKLLPHWCLTDEHPAFYDTESRTAIQMVARLYSKMQELIEDYNQYIDDINDAIQEFENSTDQKIEDFENTINDIINDFTELINGKIADQNLEIENFESTVNGKIDAQDLVIADAVNYMKTNLNQIVTELFTQTIQDRDILITLGINYYPENEELEVGLIPVVEDEVF